LKVLITGASGMVAKATIEHCRQIGDEFFAYDKKTLDISNAQAVEEIFLRDKPDAVINCAAWTDVDGCETNTPKAYSANAIGPEILAMNARLINAAFVTISTDYVFDGEKEGFYTQHDTPNPQSVYAKAKYDGERWVQAAYSRSIIVRSGWIFGENGRNFLSKVPELLKNGSNVKAIKDSFGTPTYSRDLAKRLRELAELDLPGIYHVTNSGDGTSYAGFVRAIPNAKENQIEEISFNDLRRPAPRPRNSRIRCLLSEKLGLETLPHWIDALKHFASYSTQRKESGNQMEY
jgi:dTDP-4-dehydrorhamnose reductase